MGLKEKWIDAEKFPNTYPGGLMGRKDARKIFEQYKVTFVPSHLLGFLSYSLTSVFGDMERSRKTLYHIGRQIGRMVEELLTYGRVERPAEKFNDLNDVIRNHIGNLKVGLEAITGLPSGNIIMRVTEDLNKIRIRLIECPLCTSLKSMGYREVIWKIKEPMCDFYSGLFAGWTEHSIRNNIEVECEETRCQMADKHINFCEFLITLKRPE